METIVGHAKLLVGIMLGLGGFPAIAEVSLLKQLIACGTGTGKDSLAIVEKCRAPLVSQNFSAGDLEKIQFLSSEQPQKIIDRPCSTMKAKGRCAEIQYRALPSILVVYTTQQDKIDSIALF